MNPIELRYRLALRGISLSDIARAHKVSPQQVSRVVGRTRKTRYIRAAIAEALEMTPYEVFGDDDARRQANAMKYDAASEERKAFVAALRGESEAVPA